MVLLPFSHIDALRVSGSVDQMTNISEPSGMTISGSDFRLYIRKF